MAETDSAVYLLGRRVAVLCEPYRETDCAFAAYRLDEKHVKGANFTHCTFANISFKKALVQEGTFLDCVFIGCYFRRAEFSSCRFVGCRFIDCNFNHIAIKSCDFRFSSFRHCQLPYSELLHCMPSEPNLREDLARNLFLESSRLGLSADARRYRMEEIKAREANLVSAVIARSQWYREHFDGFARLRALLDLVMSLLNRWLWGYGERAWILVRNLLIAALVVFPATFYVLRDGLAKTSSAAVAFLDFFYFSLENIVPAGIQSGVHAVSLATRIAAAVESVIGVVALALFASYVFRWSLHR